MFLTKNPVAIQSQKWIVASLLDLMKIKPYNVITIKELTEKADLDRSTFYRNFKSKEDVLNNHLNYLVIEYINKLNELQEYNMLNIFIAFLEFCDDNISFIISLRKNGLSNLLLEVFNNQLPNIHQIFQNQLAYTVKADYTEFILAFNAGGMWNLLMKWIDNDLKQSKEELIQGFEELLNFNALKE